MYSPRQFVVSLHVGLFGGAHFVVGGIDNEYFFIIFSILIAPLGVIPTVAVAICGTLHHEYAEFLAVPPITAFTEVAHGTDATLFHGNRRTGHSQFHGYQPVICASGYVAACGDHIVIGASAPHAHTSH